LAAADETTVPWAWAPASTIIFQSAQPLPTWPEEPHILNELTVWPGWTS
jgi:hypothetical protein